MKELRGLVWLWTVMMASCCLVVVVVEGGGSGGSGGSGDAAQPLQVENQKPKVGNLTSGNVVSNSSKSVNHSSLDDIFVLGPTAFPKPTAHLYCHQDRLPLVIEDPSDIVPRLEPSSLLRLNQPLRHRPEEDAILVFAMQYDWKVYMLFLESLQETGYTGDVVLAMEPTDLDKPYVRDYLTSHISKQQARLSINNETMNTVVYTIQLTVYNVHQQIVNSMMGGARGCKCHEFYQQKSTGIPLDDTRVPRPPATIRYELYWIWSLNYQPSSWLLVVDVRDTIFQTNPFASVLRRHRHSKSNENVPKYQLHLFGENQNATRLGQSKKNKRWLRQAYSEEFVQAVHDEPIICSGATMGEQAAMEMYFRAMVNEHDETLSHLFGADQGFHNYLYYTRKLLEAIDNITVFSQGIGVVNHMGAMRTKPLDTWGNGQMVQFHKKQQPPVNLTTTIKTKKQQQQPLLNVPVIYNWNGEKSPVVHQFDRFDELSAYFFKTKLFEYFNKWKQEQETTE